MNQRLVMVGLVVSTAFLAPAIAGGQPAPAKTSCSATPAASASSNTTPPPSCSANWKGGPKLEIATDACLVRIRFPRTPPTRTWCTFEADDGGESVTLEWDPLAQRGLTREVTLLPKAYSVSCQSEAARHAIDAGANYAWTFNANGSLASKLAFCDPAEIGAKVLCDQSNAHTTADVITEPRRSLEPTPNVVGGAASAVTAGTPFLGPAPRSFGALSEDALNEAFQVIAEVVVEQAKSKGLKLVTAKLTELLCDTLVTNPTASQNREPLFSRTCDATRTLRLEDLAGTGRKLLDAFVEDLVRASLGFTGDCSTCTAHFAPATCDVANRALALALEASLDAALGKPEKLKSAGQRVLLATLGAASGSSNAELQVAAGIVKECAASRCDVARIERIARDPMKYFAGLGANPPSWPEQTALVSSALGILSPSSEVTETAQLKAAIDLLFQILERLEGVRAADYFTIGGAEVISEVRGQATRLALIRELLSAAAQQNISGLAVPATRLIKKQFPGLADKDLLVVSRLAGALGAFLSTSTTGRAPTKEELEERKKARKEAIRSLIDAQTERRMRLGDTILSLGSSVGFTGAFQPMDALQVRLQPNVTLGLAFDVHSRVGFGFHAEAMPLNLGAYAAIVSQSGSDPAVAPSAADVLSPSLMLGASYVVRSADLVVVWGPTIGYAAKGGDLLDKADSKNYQGFYFGSVLAAYIPILDLN